MKAIIVSIIAALICSAGISQKVGPPDIEGFTRASPESMINEVGHPFVVRSVEGFITAGMGPRAPFPGVLFEIRGPGKDKTVRHDQTDKRGYFKIVAPEGNYRFKATANGFQSVVGTIIVSKKARKPKPIRIHMEYGV